MRHFTHLRDLGAARAQALIEKALSWKQEAPSDLMRGKILGMVFFNPSLRTRTSFEAAMIRLGGSAIGLEVGNGVWKLETQDGAVMNADRAEHVREAAPVLSRYVDALGVRSFADAVDDAADEADQVINAFRAHAQSPVISLESAREHPCQGLADLLSVREQFGATRGVPVCLSWAPHVRGLPRAVPNSFLLSAAAMGCEIRVAHPQGYALSAAVREEAEAMSKSTGGSIRYFDDPAQARNGAKVLYAKAWGATDTSAEPPSASSLAHWMPTSSHFDDMDARAIFLHCLPVRRNVEVHDSVLDGLHSRVIDNAENRFHVQRVALAWLMGRLALD